MAYVVAGAALCSTFSGLVANIVWCCLERRSSYTALSLRWTSVALCVLDFVMVGMVAYRFLRRYGTSALEGVVWQARAQTFLGICMFVTIGLVAGESLWSAAAAAPTDLVVALAVVQGALWSLAAFCQGALCALSSADLSLLPDDDPGHEYCRFSIIPAKRAPSASTTPTTPTTLTASRSEPHLHGHWIWRQSASADSSQNRPRAFSQPSSDSTSNSTSNNSCKPAMQHTAYQHPHPHHHRHHHSRLSQQSNMTLSSINNRSSFSPSAKVLKTSRSIDSILLSQPPQPQSPVRKSFYVPGSPHGPVPPPRPHDFHASRESLAESIESSIHPLFRPSSSGEMQTPVPTPGTSLTAGTTPPAALPDDIVSLRAMSARRRADSLQAAAQRWAVPKPADRAAHENVI